MYCSSRRRDIDDEPDVLRSASCTAYVANLAPELDAPGEMLEQVLTLYTALGNRRNAAQLDATVGDLCPQREDHAHERHKCLTDQGMLDQSCILVAPLLSFV